MSNIFNTHGEVNAASVQDALSAIVKYATEINKETIIARIFNNVQIINKIIFNLNNIRLCI
jgi:hypothetical protein